MTKLNLPLVLASESLARLQLLANISIIPDFISPAKLDETPNIGERPHLLAIRLAKAKVIEVAKKFDTAIILAADTVSSCGLRILPKALNDEQVKQCLSLLSGRRHNVTTAISILRIEQNRQIKFSTKFVKTIVKFKRLEPKEINYYIASKQGIDKSGGCNIEGLAAGFVSFISGSYSNIIGLPLFETKNLLQSNGYIIK